VGLQFLFYRNLGRRNCRQFDFALNQSLFEFAAFLHQALEFGGSHFPSLLGALEVAGKRADTMIHVQNRLFGILNFDRQARPELLAFTDETFQPEEIEDLIRRSGLTLVQPIDDRVWQRYEMRPVRLQVDPYQSPHMTVQLDDTIFTSVMLFLRK